MESEDIAVSKQLTLVYTCSHIHSSNNSSIWYYKEVLYLHALSCISPPRLFLPLGGFFDICTENNKRRLEQAGWNAFSLIGSADTCSSLL